ncbi:MAG: hypothetical protein H6725_15180 [Sandaracinaceae bacterium]|nr:hypothetical protein [Sandaracinaceae bacterium]
MSRELDVGVARVPAWVTALPLACASLMTLQGCGLDASGCAQGCASGCAECDALDGCGCTTGPIPGGFDREREVNNAIQVRLGPSGLRFLEENAQSLAASALMSDEDLRIPIDPALVRVSDTEVVALCAGEEALVFSGAAGSTSRTLSPAQDQHLWFVTEGGSLNTTLTVTRTTGPGAPVELLRREGGNTVLASHVVFGDLQLQAGVTYRVTLAKPTAALATTVHAFGGGRCAVDLSLGALDLDAVTGDPDALRVMVGAGAQSLDGSGARAPFPVDSYATVGVVPAGCTVDLDTAAPGGASDTIGVALRAGIAAVQEGLRAGYSRLDVSGLELVAPGIENSDFTFGGCAASGLLNPFRGVIVSAIENQLPSAAEGFSHLCQPARANPASAGDVTLCPAGSTPNDDDICIEDASGECVPFLLGLETRLSPGPGTAAFLPGLRAAFDTLFALEGEGTAVSDGYSLSMVAGAESLETSTCIDLSAVTTPPMRPSDIALAGALRGGEDTHDVGLAVSERFINWSLFELWRAGFFCVEVNSSAAQQLSTGLFSLLIPSLKALTFPEGAASMAVALRPAQPPVLTVGAGTEESALMRVFFPSLSVDLYVFSTERYVRVLTLTMDLGADVNVQVADGRVLPLLGLTVDNATVTNAGLLREDAEALARVLPNVLSSFAPMFTQDLAPIDPAALAGDALPIGISLTQDSLRLVTEGSGAGAEAFLGVFVDLAQASPSPLEDAEPVRVRITSMDLGDGAAFALETFGEGRLPRIDAAFEVDAADGSPREYSYRLDGGAWSEYRAASYAVIEDAALLRQGEHALSVRSRPVGSTRFGSLGRERFVVDVTPPMIELAQDRTSFWAVDTVEEQSSLQYRTLSADAGWSAWRVVGRPEVTLDTPVEGLEVRDSSGNVSSTYAALRGLPPPDAAGCDGCATQSSRASGAGGWLAGALVLGVVVRRRRRR